MATDVRELPGARWVTHGTRLLAGLYVWLCGWLAIWVALPVLLLPLSPTVISSGSMGPAINRGDVVVMATDGLDGVGVGQVVTFRRDGRADGVLLTHRIYAIDGDGRMITKGDANPTRDSSTIDHTALVGRGQLLVPYVGLPVLWLRESPLVFLAWLVLTSVAVALARAGVPTIDALVDDEGEPVLDLGRGWWRPLDRALGLIEGPPRPPAGPVRAWAPTAASALALAVVARGPFGAALALLVVAAVLLADPRGPHLPVGRLLVAVADLRARMSDQLVPRVREQGSALVLPLVVVASIGLVLVPSRAAFSASLAAAGNEMGSGIWECSTPGVHPVTIEGDTWVTEASPTTTYATAPTLLVDGDRPRARAYLQVDLTPPVGCVAGNAELVLEVVSGVVGERVEARAVTAAFDPAAISWQARPPVDPQQATADAIPGQVALDVSGLVRDDVRGFELVVAGEDGDAGVDDGDVGSFLVEALEGTSPPRLLVDWREP